MRPAFGRRSPDSVLSIVVLPAPLAPTTATISPAGISRLMPHRAWILPYATSRASTWSTPNSPFPFPSRGDGPCSALGHPRAQIGGDDARVLHHALGRA